MDNNSSFTCTCNDGYNGTGVHCSNIDECALDTDNCHVRSPFASLCIVAAPDQLI